jgi:hypothetical protein
MNTLLTVQMGLETLDLMSREIGPAYEKLLYR